MTPNRGPRKSRPGLVTHWPGSSFHAPTEPRSRIKRPHPTSASPRAGPRIPWEHHPWHAHMAPLAITLAGVSGIVSRAWSAGLWARTDGEGERACHCHRCIVAVALAIWIFGHLMNPVVPQVPYDDTAVAWYGPISSLCSILGG